MKKRELILDFTSLLDVIMILLFVVIGNMSLASVSANAAAKAETEAAQSALEEEQAELEAAAEKNNELEAELAELVREAEQLQQKNADLELELKVLLENHTALLEEYDYLKIITDFDANDTSAYGQVIERMTKVLLLCETGQNEATGLPEVRVGIYRSGGTEQEKSYVTSVVLAHDVSLSKEERAELVAGQVTELTKALSGALRKNAEEVVWCSVQYAYDDENFSQSDLEVIEEAIRNLERSFSKTCFMEKIKIY
jgi:biopolymer transport protein ExbD